MYGIYNIYNNNDLIYVGKTNNFYTRLRNHMALQPWKNEITHIAIAECKNKIDMDLYEKYYINKLNPKYNKAIVYNESPTFEIEGLDFKKFELNEFLKINNQKIGKVKNNIGVYEKRKKEVHEILKNSIEIKEGEKVDFLKSSYNLYHWSNSLKTEINFLEVKCDNLFFRELLQDIKNNKCELIDNEYEFKFKNREDIFRNAQQYSVSLKIDSYIIGEKRISKGFCIVNLTSGMCLDTKTKDVTIHIDKCMIDEYFCKYFLF